MRRSIPRVPPSSVRKRAMISVTLGLLSAQQALLSLLHLGLPEAMLLEEAHGRRVKRDRRVGADGPIARPLLEHGMDRPELALVVPQCLQGNLDRDVGKVLAGRQVAVVGDEAGVLDDGGGLALLAPARVIAGRTRAHPLLPSARAVVGDVP